MVGFLTWLCDETHQPRWDLMNRTGAKFTFEPKGILAEKGSVWCEFLTLTIVLSEILRIPQGTLFDWCIIAGVSLFPVHRVLTLYSISTVYIRSSANICYLSGVLCYTVVTCLRVIYLKMQI